MDQTPTKVDRRAFLRAAAGATASLPVLTRRASAQPKPTISYWNGLTGADGKIMDELIDQFTKDTGIRIEQQRIPWADLYAKLQVSVPAGQGPDLALIHTIEVPHFANDGVLEAIDESRATAKGFRADDYLPSTWQGGVYQGKRAKQITKGDTFGFSIGTVNPGKYTWGFQNLLWQNGANVYAADLKRSALAEPAAIEVAEFWGAIHAQHKVALPANANCRDAFIAGKLGIWIAGSWNFTGLREAKVDFAVSPVPKLFKQPVVWSMPHQFTFPKPKAADNAKRDAAWAYMRWISDHVAEWTLKAGQVSALRKPHSDPRITGDPVLRTLLAQAPNWQGGQPTPKWVAAENLTRPVIESVYIGQKPAAAAMQDLARQINALPD